MMALWRCLSLVWRSMSGNASARSHESAYYLDSSGKLSAAREPPLLQTRPLRFFDRSRIWPAGLARIPPFLRRSWALRVAPVWSLTRVAKAPRQEPWAPMTSSLGGSPSGGGVKCRVPLLPLVTKLRFVTYQGVWSGQASELAGGLGSVSCSCFCSL